MFQNNVRRYVFEFQIDRTLLSMFCTWSVTPWKKVSHELPLPLGISNDLPWGGGYGYFLEPHIKDSLLLCPLMGLDIKKTCNQNKILLHDKIFESLKY